jgi:hypothetical protein
MHAMLLALTLAAAPIAKVKLALPDIQAVGIDPKLATFFGEHLATQLKLEGMQVVTSREISSLLGLERQAALLGCSDQASSCMAELASALGADAVILADLARLGEKTQVNLKVISARDGRTLGVFVDRVKGDEEVADAMARGAQQLAKDVLALLRPEGVGGEVQSARPGLTQLWWAPTAGGAALALTGAVLFGLGKSDYSRLTGASILDLDEAAALRDGGSTKQNAGMALLISGAAIAAAGVAMLLFGSSGDGPQLAVVPSGHGGTVWVGGTFR